MTTLAVDRRHAIEQSGWGEEFRLVQPHNLAFWVYCFLVVAGGFVLVDQISIAAAAYSGALISGVIAFTLLGAAYLWFIRHEDRYTTVPPKLAAAGFVWGFVAATGAFAMIANGAVTDLLAKTFGASFAFDWGAALAAPINEELAKGAGILLLLTLAPQLIRSPFDGLILGAFVGLGFQISEDISYAWIGAANSFGDVDAAWSTIVVRTLASIPSHWMFTAIFGAGLIWFVGRPDVPARRGLGAGLMLTSILMHSLWNAAGAIAGSSAFGWTVPLFVTATLITVFIWVYETAQPIERDWMRELLAPEVGRGVVTHAELDALAGTRSTYRSYIRAQRYPRTAERVLEAEKDLAHQIARDDGAETAAVEQARAAVAHARRR
ncbi:MAG TPA: PrsW family intramembrane metalloprotease [Gaiellaceae bacterium]|nr:PrsW family intramembrane metalloprotease [Gaiellaceae bacterium]